MFPMWKDLQAFPTWKDLQAFPTWKDLTDLELNLERRAEQAHQQMWLEYTEVMHQTQAQVHALACRLDLRLEELEARQWLPELPPGLPQQRFIRLNFIPHWSSAVGAAELAEGFPPIDLTPTEQVLVAIAKLTEEAIREVGLEDDLPILLDECLDPWHMAEVGWSPNFMFAYLLYFAQNSNLVFSDLQMFLLLGGPRSKFWGLRFGLCGIISTCATENTHEQAPSRT